MERYNPKIIKNLIGNIVLGAGVSEFDAIIFADSLVEADVAETLTHGYHKKFSAFWRPFLLLQ